MIPRIKWLRKERKLLKLFSLLNENRFLNSYDAEEILNHFSILNSGGHLNLFCTAEIKFLWHGSDNEFCFLINQLVKKKFIPAHKKYKITGDHFLNREGKRFIYLAQKHNFTKNYLQTKELIIDIVNRIAKLD